MILNNAPQQEAVLSNVGQIGEFRIRNSAKAFNILSSGLYANKVRAIIRELSCNAVDSHVAAGKADTPFEVHLPTALEPWFAVRDFGTGLNHEQVTQIYTTYFESTKTDSNAFIGALGLGSKSPFSYTDNFTVTATQSGVKRIYSAFINEQGVPSIVKMGEEESTDENGVEVKFSVNDRYDFNKFANESEYVFRHFKLLPTFTGYKVVIAALDYETMNIVPGVHHQNDVHGLNSIALMGNIAYPIEVPSADTTLGDLRKLLSCGLVMEFDIGELDFQASREGLSYIPSTIESIKRKLELLNSQLAVHIAKELDAIDNLWDRSIALYRKKSSNLYSSAALQYATDTNFELFEVQGNRWLSHFTIELSVKELAELNISVSSFSSARHSKVCGARNPDTRRVGTNTTGQPTYESTWRIPVSDNVFFVLNDTKTGVTERAKHHWRNKEDRAYSEIVYALSKIDKTKDMDTEAFFKLIRGGRSENILKGSDLLVKERQQGQGFGKNVTILTLDNRESRGRRTSNALWWRDAGKLDSFSDTETFYYIPLSGFEPLWTKCALGCTPHDIVTSMRDSKLPELAVRVYGVRKGDFKEIEKCSNWINLEKYVEDTLKTMTSKVFMCAVKESIDNNKIFEYNVASIVEKIKNDASPAKVLLKQFLDLPKSGGYYSINRLWNTFMKDSPIKVEAVISKYSAEFKEFYKRYPMVNELGYSVQPSVVAEYFEQIDTLKGI